MSPRRAATRGAARPGALLHWLDESKVEALTDEHLDCAGQDRDDPPAVRVNGPSGVATRGLTTR